MKSLRSLLRKNGDLPVFSTPGGITPPNYKSHTLVSRIMPMPLPEELALSLQQKDGLELQLEVAIGASVSKNQLIASPRTNYGVPLYAPTSGIVARTERRLIASAFESYHLHVVIEVDGENSVMPLKAVKNTNELEPATLRRELHRLGVSGLGGADFPTTIKLRKASATKIAELIINAAECEPFISADEALIRENAAEVIAGATFLQKASEATTCVIAIEEDKLDAINALRAANLKHDIKIAIVTAKYPTGSEKLLIQAVTGKEVPSGSLPMDIGVLVQNAGTAFAAYEAIVKGQPCISRVTTLAGTPLQTPKNFRVLLGTPIPFLFDICGIDSDAHESTIIGGSLMGVSLFSDAVAITRASNCVIAASAAWFPPTVPETACIRCGYCADVCPVNLLPQQLVAFAKIRDSENLISHSLPDCIECGACSYVCPSKIPLVEYFKAGKTMVSQEAEQAQLSEHWQDRYQYHQYRTAKLKQDALTRKRKLSLKTEIESTVTSFSRTKAKADIAAAVNRVKKRKSENLVSKLNNPEDSAR
ncbi:MAG: electron transport complex subunit RsxC [Pseudohongiellaceae bacterium]